MEDEDIYAPLGVNDEYDSIQSTAKAVAIANRPPAPTPRPESTQVKEDKTPYIAKGNLSLCCRILSSKKTQRELMELELCSACEGEFWEIMWEGGSAWNVHCHCQWSAAEQS